MKRLSGLRAHAVTAFTVLLPSLPLLKVTLRDDVRSKEVRRRGLGGRSPTKTRFVSQENGDTDIRVELLAEVSRDVEEIHGIGSGSLISVCRRLLQDAAKVPDPADRAPDLPARRLEF